CFDLRLPDPSQELNRMNRKKLLDFLRRKIYRKPLVDLQWSIKLATRNLWTRKIKVGFGPITTGEKDLAERKWRNEPVMKKNNALNKEYSAGFFLKPEQMKRFDILVIVKKFNPTFVPIISRLKAQGRLFIYDIVDNPNSEKTYSYYFGDHPEFSSLMDGFILS